MARRVDPTTQIPTRQQACFLLLASQAGGTYQGECCRVLEQDSMGTNFQLRALLGGVYRQQVGRVVGGKLVNRPCRRYGRGWLTRRVHKRGKVRVDASILGRRARKVIRHEWRYKITPQGQAALERYAAEHPGHGGTLPQMVSWLADKLRGWAAISGGKKEDCVWAAMAMRHPNKADYWQGVRRGRDLRFPGWGPCDVARGLKVAISVKPELHWSKLQDVGSLQIASYSGVPTRQQRLIQDELPPVWCDWLRRYKDWWFGGREFAGDVVRMRRLDEIGQCVRYGILPDAHPEVVFGRLEAHYRADDENATAQQELKLAEPFAAGPAQLATPQGWMLNTITSDEGLREVGKKLHNCVGGYGLSCREQGRLIAVLTNDQGKPLACGEWVDGEWGQIAGPCNNEPDQVVVVAFQQYGRQLAKLAFNKNTIEGKVEGQSDSLIVR